MIFRQNSSHVVYTVSEKTIQIRSEGSDAKFAFSLMMQKDNL